MNNFQPGYPQYGNGYNQNQYASQYQSQYKPLTNKQFVSCLEEAMSIRAGYNSEMVYFDSNYDVMYNIFTDSKGNKEYTIIDLSIRKPEKPADVTSEILKRLDEIEKKLGGQDGKYNAKSADTADSGTAQ